MSKETSILVVDDDEDILCNVKDILEDMGYRTDTAKDGPSALRLVEQHSYDIALLDFKMPGIDGATLYAEIKKVRPEIVAIMVTAYAGSDGVEKARQAGTWRVLRKPVDFDHLLPLLEQASNEPIVLVVDDDAEVCENLWQLLRERGYRVRIARSEGEGLNEADQALFDVAIVDLRLGVGDGRKVISRIRAMNARAKIIVTTGFPESLGAPMADMVLQKPIDIEKMLAALPHKDQRAQPETPEQA